MNIKRNLSFLKRMEGKILTIIATLLSLNMMALANRKSLNSIFSVSQNPDIFYGIFFILLVAATGTLLYYSRKINIQAKAKKIFFFFLPFEISLLFSLFCWKPELNFLFWNFSALYLFIAAFFSLQNLSAESLTEIAAKITVKKWFAKQGISTLITLFTIVVIFGFFGSWRISQFAAVDEPLWTFDRIPSYWKNVKQLNWSNTNISDKPGITVALVSGIGLLDVNPKQYDPKIPGSKDLNIQEMNSALRLPILLFATLMLPVFYFLLERLLGIRTALLSTAFIGLSPILLGMSRIINPDALLWVFAPLSLISFLIYQKKRLKLYLYLTGIFLGLAILTKYVANILYVFLFGMLFIEYILNNHRYKNISLRKYLVSALRDFLMLITISLAVFYILYPGTWLRPDRLFTGTILSQAFVSTWPIFAAFFSLIFADILFFKNKFSKITLGFLIERKKILINCFVVCFLLIIAFVLFNTYAGMKFYDFQEILASPKTSFKENGFIALVLSNFYPLLFAISPIAVIGLLVKLTRSLRSRTIAEEDSTNVALFLSFFIFAYYFGTTVNNVVSTTRYQIILYPLVLIISAMGIVFIYESFEKKYSWKKFSFTLLSIIIISISAISLYLSKPFYLSYASSLLPQENFLDLKDMGPGSYEAAQYLNSLPNAEKLSIWTDKTGVCNFFKGSCYGDLSFDDLSDISLDYVVVSWGRKSRTSSIVRSQSRLYSHKVFNFAKYYDQEENVVFKILINDRPAQYVKVIKVDNN